jgi:hypothetical protein
MPDSSDRTWHDHSKYIWRRVQIAVLHVDGQTHRYNLPTTRSGVLHFFCPSVFVKMVQNSFIVCTAPNGPTAVRSHAEVIVSLMHIGRADAEERHDSWALRHHSECERMSNSECTSESTQRSEFLRTERTNAYHISPNIRRDFLFKPFFFLEKRGGLIFQFLKNTYEADFYEGFLLLFKDIFKNTCNYI